MLPRPAVKPGRQLALSQLQFVRCNVIGILVVIIGLQFAVIAYLTSATLGDAHIKIAPAFLRKLYYKPDVAHLLKAASGHAIAAAEVSGYAGGGGNAPVGSGFISAAVDDPFVTRQLCYNFADESEICVYEGPVCVNNKEQIVIGAPAEVPHIEALYDDGRSRCLDYRYFERRDACAYTGPFKRPNLPEEWYKKPLHKSQTSKAPSMPMGGRRYGPDDHASAIAGIPWDILVAVTTSGMKNLPLSWQKAAAKVNLQDALAKRDRLGRVGGLVNSVRWVHASGYVIPMEGGWLDHPWHWATATFGLWDAKNHNFSVSNVPLSDGVTPGPLNYTTGGYFFPPMDYVVAQGHYKPYRYALPELIPWAETLFPLLTQKQTKVMLNGNLLSSFNLTTEQPNDFVCFTRGAVLGIKPRLFTSVGDAHSFRLMAYAASGVKIPAHGSQPPRKITVMGRFSRGFADMKMILRVLQDTGLPVRVVENLRFLSFAEQVALMADTGILLAAHGGALANVIYMPAHSVVIEAFPYLTFFTMYQRLAQVANLQYYRLRGFRPDPTIITYPNGTKEVKDPWASYNEADFVHDCEWPHHTSSVDAMLQRSCNGKTKITPIAIDEGSFRAVLDMALDDIECKDSICRFDDQRAAPEKGTLTSSASRGGPNKGVIYKDMLTNETWSPVNGPWQSSVLSSAEAPKALARSKGVQGRIWKPTLFHTTGAATAGATASASGGGGQGNKDNSGGQDNNNKK